MSATEQAPRSMTVTVVVRSVDDGDEGTAITLPYNARVRELKERVLFMHPRHPAMESQKLIFGGSVLEDLRPLREVFIHCSDSVQVPTVRLLITGDGGTPSRSSTSTPASRSMSRVASVSSLAPEEPPRTATPFAPAASTASPQSTLSSLPGSGQSRVVVVPCVLVNGVPYVLPSSLPVPHASPLPSVASGSSAAASGFFEHVRVETPAPAPAAAPAPAPVPAQARAQDAAAPEDLNRNRSVLWFILWSAVRSLVIMLMFAQHAPVYKKILYFVISFVFFLFNGGYIGGLVRAAGPANNNQRPAAPENAPAPPAEGAEEEEAEDGEDDDDPPPAPMLETVKGMVWAFFCTLLPISDPLEVAAPPRRRRRQPQVQE